MPHTINGIGTWYYGKRNLFTRPGTCPQCGQIGQLRSYDTTLFVVVFFIPVIPLGAKRILDDCSNCSRHRAMRLKDYEAARRGALADAVQAWQNEPGNAQAAHQVVSLTVSYRDPENFQLVAGPVERGFPRDASVQSLLAAAHEFFGDDVPAERCWRQSLQLADTEDTREALAANLCRQKRPEEAAPFLHHIVAARKKEGVGLLYLAVESFQALGRHREALAFLQQIEEVAPAEALDREHRRYAKLARKHLQSGKPVRSAALAQHAEVRPGGWRWQIPRIAALLVAAAVLVSLLVASWQNIRATEVWLLNGTSGRYEVEIDGQRHAVPRYGRVPIRLAYGRHEIATHPQPPGETPFAYVLDRPWLSRLTDHSVHIVNPDRCAVLLHETIIYTSQERPPAEPPKPIEPGVDLGQISYRLARPDYVFTTAPANIRMDEQREVENRSVLTQWEPDSANAAYEAVAEAKGEEVAHDFLRRQSMWNAELDSWIYLYAGQAGPTSALEVARAWLPARPVMVHMHRAYQSLVERAAPGHDLVGEYRRLSAAEPQNRLLLYLLGRCVTDPVEAQGLFERCEQGDRPIGWGLYAMAFNELAAGQFEPALDHIEQAMRVLPDTREIRPRALLAAGRYADLRKHLAATRTARNPFQHLDIEFQCMVGMGQPEAVQVRADQLVAAARRDKVPEEEMAVIQAELEIAAAAARGDWDTFTRRGPAAGPRGAYQAALAALNLAEAERAWSALELDSDAWTVPALFALVAHLAGDRAAEDRYSANALRQLNEGGASERQAAAWFSAGGAPVAEDITRLAMLPEEKRILLALLGVRRPETSAVAFTLARRLNFRANYIQRVVALAAPAT